MIPLHNLTETPHATFSLRYKIRCSFFNIWYFLLKTVVFCSSGILRNIRLAIPRIFTSEGKMLAKNITFNWKSNTSRYILVMLKISLYLFCFLLFSYETYWKCRENYSDSFGGISKNISCRQVNIWRFILFAY